MANREDGSEVLAVIVPYIVVSSVMQTVLAGLSENFCMVQ